MEKDNSSDLKKALFTFLYDQYDLPDLETNESDDSFIDNIISALIQSNGETCPYKNYDCIGKCEFSQIGCMDGLNIDCGKDAEGIWKAFIGIDAEK